jgi:hypothetical protein
MNWLSRHTKNIIRYGGVTPLFLKSKLTAGEGNTQNQEYLTNPIGQTSLEIPPI